MFRNMEPDEYHVKVVETKEEIVSLLEEGFEYIWEKMDLHISERENSRIWMQ